MSAVRARLRARLPRTTLGKPPRPPRTALVRSDSTIYLHSESSPTSHLRNPDISPQGTWPRVPLENGLEDVSFCEPCTVLHLGDVAKYASPPARAVLSRPACWTCHSSAFRLLEAVYLALQPRKRRPRTNLHRVLRFRSLGVCRWLMRCSLCCF